MVNKIIKVYRTVFRFTEKSRRYYREFPYAAYPVSFVINIFCIFFLFVSAKAVVDWQVNFLGRGDRCLSNRPISFHTELIVFFINTIFFSCLSVTTDIFLHITDIADILFDGLKTNRSIFRENEILRIQIPKKKCIIFCFGLSIIKL